MSRIGYHTAASALQAIQIGMDITGNNLANVNTNGFKASRADFADLIYTERNADETVQTGHGVRVDKSNMIYTQGHLKDTGRMLDFAAVDNGFFAVETIDGDIKYTKDGSFYFYDTDGFLHDSNGGYVLDYELNRIECPLENGNLNYTLIGSMVGVFTFENSYGLDQAGLNYYSETDASGAAVPNETIAKKQGYVEASTTSVATEMVRAIEYQRAFQLNANMVKTHDELEDRVNNLR